MTWLSVLTANCRLQPAPTPPSANRIRRACASVADTFGAGFAFPAFLWVRDRDAFSARNAASCDRADATFDSTSRPARARAARRRRDTAPGSFSSSDFKAAIRARAAAS